MLDDLELPQVQEIDTRDRRVLAEHKPPGMSGSLLQNLGRRPARLVLGGIATGPKALDFTKKLDAKFRAAKPVPFTADIVADAKIDKVLIEEVRFEQLAGKPDRYSFLLTLREYIKPVEPETAKGIDTDIAGDAEKLVQNVTAGLDILKQLGTMVGQLTKLSRAL